MGLIWTGLAAIGVVISALILGALYSQPVPKGFKSPWKLRVIFAYSTFAEFLQRDVLRRYRDPGEAVLSRRGYKGWPSPEMESLPVDLERVDFDGVEVLLLKPRELPEKNNPGIVQLHGGGWTNYDTDFYQDYCRHLAHETKSIVASVEYRRAPEHIYPAALEDSVTAAIHFIKNAEKYGVDANRVALVGDSAGGNLAAAVSIKLRDIKFSPMPKLQVLIYPCTQAVDFLGPSYQEQENHPFLHKSSMAVYWLFYAVGHARYLNELMNSTHVPPQLKKSLQSERMSHEEILKTYKNTKYQPQELTQENSTVWHELKAILTDPYYAPLMSNDLSGVPEALVFTVEDDILRDDGIWYAEHLRSFGVKVTHKHYEAGFHGLVPWPFHMDENTQESRQIIHQFIRENL